MSEQSINICKALIKAVEPIAAVDMSKNCQGMSDKERSIYLCGYFDGIMSSGLIFGEYLANKKGG